MSQETLKRLRLVIPGILVVLVVPPLFQGQLDWGAYLERFKSVKVVADSMAAIVIGALYEILDLRRFAWRRSLRTVEENIKNRLLAACSDDAKLAAAGWLRQGRSLMHVFYRFVDGDPTLREKMKRVYFNGLLWSSLVDVTTVGLLGSVAYWIAFRVTNQFDHLAMAVGLGLISVLTYFVLMPLVTRRHLDLSNEQLEIIEQHFRSELCAELRTVADGG